MHPKRPDRRICRGDRLGEGFFRGPEPVGVYTLFILFTERWSSGGALVEVKMRRALSEVIQDGRRRRSEESRERIIRAMLTLLSAGEVTPSAEAVAEEAGVGLRTVFRHFDNMDSLYQQIYASIEAEIRPIVARPFASEGGAARVEEIIERRISVFERIMPMKIAADVHRHRSHFLDAQARAMVKEQRAVLQSVLPEEVRRDAGLFEALDLLLSFETWRRLRKDQTLSRAKAREVLRGIVLGLLNRGDPQPA